MCHDWQSKCISCTVIPLNESKNQITLRWKCIYIKWKYGWNSTIQLASCYMVKGVRTLEGASEYINISDYYFRFNKCVLFVVLGLLLKNVANRIKQTMEFRSRKSNKLVVWYVNLACYHSISTTSEAARRLFVAVSFYFWRHRWLFFCSKIYYTDASSWARKEKKMSIIKSHRIKEFNSYFHCFTKETYQKPTKNYFFFIWQFSRIVLSWTWNLRSRNASNRTMVQINGL